MNNEYVVTQHRANCSHKPSELFAMRIFENDRRTARNNVISVLAPVASSFDDNNTWRIIGLFVARRPATRARLLRLTVSYGTSATRNLKYVPFLFLTDAATGLAWRPATNACYETGG